MLAARLRWPRHLSATDSTVSNSSIPPFPDASQSLRDSLLEARALYDQAGCGYHAATAEGLLLEVNDTLLQWLGYQRDELVGKRHFRDLITPASQPTFDVCCAQFSVSGQVRNLEVELICASGEAIVALVSATAVRDRDGHCRYVQALLVDISVRHRAERRAERLAQRTFRALRVLSAMNAELVNADQEKTFLDAVCRMVVNRGGYRLASVGYAEHDRQRRVRVAAQASANANDGTDNDEASISWADNAIGQGPTGRAIRTGTLQISQNILTDPQMTAWQDQARAAGYQSAIALPLSAGGVVIGALSIWAPEPDAFDGDEADLLMELANGLAFGIHTVRARIEHLRAQEMVAWLAYHDPLTGLANRPRLLIRIRDAMTQTAAGQPLALMTVVIERFSDILAGIGVRPADQLLAQVADRLTSTLGGRASAARVGSKSFAVLLIDTAEAAARDCAQQLRDAMRPSFMLAGIPVGIEISIGVAMAPAHADDAETLLLRSGLAARAAASSPEACEFYSGSALEDRRWLALLGDLRAAIEEQQLRLYYQPKIDVRSGQVAGAEALLRWTHPQRGKVSPAEFMPIAEQTGVIAQLTDYVLDAVLRQLRAWCDQGFVLPVAVNVSVRNFSDAGFVDRVISGLARHGVDPSLLQLELTESTLMEEPSRTRSQLSRLQRHGVTTSIDDFGTGYSSLAYIANLPVASLKIDRSFVSRMHDSPRVQGIVAATISMAEALALGTVAEGVENRAQAEALIALGCDQLQGYWFCRPVPADTLRNWVQSFQPQVWGLVQSADLMS